MVGHLFSLDHLLVPHHRPAAVTAVNQAFQDIFALSQVIVLSQIGAVFFLLQITNGLYRVEILLADNGLMSVLHNGPF